MAAMLASCSSDNLSVAQKSAETEGPGIEGAVNFSAYTGRSVTRAGAPGKLVTENAGAGEVPLETLGFGVFGYYTDQQDYDLQISKPNFMYNEQVTKTAGNWTYEPVKYWPNEYGSDAESQDIDKVSFFAYAPYVDVNPTTGKVTEQADYGITAVSRNTNTGDPIVWYKGSFDPAQNVDLCWGVVGSTTDATWNIIQDRAVQQMEVGLPWLNVQRPEGTTAAQQKLKFTFKHALAQLNIQIDADPDLTEHNTTPALPTETKVYVRSITLGGIASKGSLNLNNIVANEPLWQSYYGSGSIYAETATITDGRRDGKEGVSGATATNETLTGLNYVIISNDGNTTAGVTNQLGNLFNSTPPTAPIYVIPTGEPITVSIVYDVETADDNLASVLSDGTTRGSSIENKITKEVVFGQEEFLSAGHLYTLKLHLGLNSVKFDADVSNWQDDATEGNSWLPNNVAKGVAIQSAGVTVNQVLTPAAGGAQLTAVIQPSDVTNQEIQWSLSGANASNAQLSATTDASVTVTPDDGFVGPVTVNAYNPGTGKTATITAYCTHARTRLVAADQGRVVATDGNIYLTKSDAETYATAPNTTGVAMVADVDHGLAYALRDYSTPQMTWDNATRVTSEEFNTAYGTTGLTWRLPTVRDMQFMFQAVGANNWSHIYDASDDTQSNGTETDGSGDRRFATENSNGLGNTWNAVTNTGNAVNSSRAHFDVTATWTSTTGNNSNRMVSYGRFRQAIVDCGGTNPQSYGYWLHEGFSTANGWRYYFSGSAFWTDPKSTRNYVRPVLAL